VDVLYDGSWLDPVSAVVLFLEDAASFCLIDRFPHRSRHLVSVKQNSPIDISRCSACGLYERGLAAKKAFFVSVQNGNQCDFGQVESFPKQIDPDQDIELSPAQGRNDLNPL
jgi:hypothetical protein